MNDEVVQFGVEQGLVGILSRPSQSALNGIYQNGIYQNGIYQNGASGTEASPLPAVIILNAGLLHRVGPNRIYVKIARALAAEGFTVMRFDFSGLGDSRPRADHMPYLQSAPNEAQAAMDWLTEHCGAQRFILLGHCAGAGISFLVAGKDSRVAGAALLNLEGGNEQWTEYDRIKKESRYYANYYGKRALFSRERWRKLLSGQAAYRNIASNIWNGVILLRLKALLFRMKQAQHTKQSNTQAQQEQTVQTYLQPVLDRNVALLLLHSEGSTGLAHLRTIFGSTLDQLHAAGRLQLTIIPQSDHLFTLVAKQNELRDALVAWTRKHFLTSNTPRVTASSPAPARTQIESAAESAAEVAAD